MKYPPEHKRTTTQRLRRRAAEQVRGRGFDGVSVNSVMAAEGLTVGGFYAHFDSKEALLAEAVDAAFEDGARNLRRASGSDDEDGLAQVVAGYLSAVHRDNAERGCPVAALMGEIGRQPEAVRGAFQGRLEALIGRYAAALGTGDENAARDRATALLALLAGGVQLARAVADPERSDRILQACARAARELAGPGAGAGDHDDQNHDNREPDRS